MCHESLTESIADRCRDFLRRHFIPELVAEYIAEAEHGDGIAYWSDHFEVAGPDGDPSIDFDSLRVDFAAFVDAFSDDAEPTGPEDRCIGREVELTEALRGLRAGARGTIVDEYLWDERTGERKWTVRFGPHCFVEARKHWVALLPPGGMTARLGPPSMFAL